MNQEVLHAQPVRDECMVHLQVMAKRTDSTQEFLFRRAQGYEVYSHRACHDGGQVFAVVGDRLLG